VTTPKPTSGLAARPMPKKLEGCAGRRDSRQRRDLLWRDRAASRLSFNPFPALTGHEPRRNHRPFAVNSRLLNHPFALLAPVIVLTMLVR
jgi:hypothetical protein